MDPIKNPFSPGAGSPPYELFGRREVLDRARILLGRTKAKRSEKSMLLTGLRGVGKTVLLGEMEHMAREECGYRTIFVEALEGKELALLLVPYLRQLFFELNRLAGTGDKIRRGLAILKGFVSSLKVRVGDLEVGLDIEPERGTADSGDIQIDLPNLLVALAEAAEERKTAVAIFIDEIQYFKTTELGALIMSLHRMQQRLLPLILIGAGLPTLPALAGESKSYAERLLDFPAIGPLERADAFLALQDPVTVEGATFEEGALVEIFNQTKGYPYFLQEWGYQAWNLSSGPLISLDTVRRATRQVSRRLDENFFRVRFDRLTPKEKHYLRAMASIGGGPYRSADVASVLGKTPSSLGTVRDQLIRKGMIYSPEHGRLDFTVPLFDSFIRREIPGFDALE